MTEDWRPGVSTKVLQQRARLLQQIRGFMDEHGILEVNTPVLGHATVTDPNIQSFVTTFHHPGKQTEDVLYLQPSPEYAMKRLLAAGSGPIYQITPVFREAEAGQYHNPEFYMLEWYQPGFDHHKLMVQLDVLLQHLGFNPAHTKTYAEVFENAIGLNPHLADLTELQDEATTRGLVQTEKDRPMLLDYLFSHAITTDLGQSEPIFIVDYPACQCALARLTQTTPPVAERFELFIRGMEVANGYHELCDESEQSKRFTADNLRRQNNGLPVIPLDEKFLQALSSGLPSCAGVSVGLDRLIMVMHQYKTIIDVIAFPIDRI